MSCDPVSKTKLFQKASNVVSVNNVSKTYPGGFPVLQNFSMNVEKGQIYGLIGSSGCGKSTVLSCIVGLKNWDNGTICVLGKNVKKEIFNQDIGYMPQEVALYGQLTVHEILQFYSKIFHISHKALKERTTFLKNLLKIDGYEGRRIVSLSGGEQRRISLALTILHNPKLLFLDEPTVGLDPLLREKIWDYLFHLTVEKKTTIIITTHYIEEVKYAHKVGIMKRGTLLVENCPEFLMKTHNTFLLEDAVSQIIKKDNLTNISNTQIIIPLSESTSRNQEKWNEQRNENLTGERSQPTLTNFIERIIAYTKVIWINFLRQPIFIVLLLVLPPMQIVTTGLIFGQVPLSNTLGIVNKEVLNWRENCNQYTNETCQLSFISCKLVQNLDSSIYLKINQFSTDEKALSAVKQGEIMGYIVIPENYTFHIIERAIFGLYSENTTINGTIIQVNLDMSNSIIGHTIMKTLSDGIAKLSKELSVICNINISWMDDPSFFRKPVYGNQNVTVTEYMIPALITSIMFEVAFCAAPLILINEMQQGILDRSKVAGFKLFEMMIGIFLAIISITLFQAIICFISVEFFLGIRVQGTISAFILLCVKVAICSGSIGLMVGIWMMDTVAVIITGIFLFPILMMYSGTFQVVEAITNPFRTIIFFLIPNVSICTSFRWIINRGVSLTHPMIWPGVLITVGWFVAFSSICAFLLRRI